MIPTQVIHTKPSTQKHGHMQTFILWRGRIDRTPTQQQLMPTTMFKDFYNRGIVFGNDGGCLSGPSIYVLSLGLLTGINKFLSYSWDDGLFQPVVQTYLIPAPGKLQPYHYFSYEVISTASFTVSRLVKLQRILRRRLNASARLVIRTIAKGCAPRGFNFDSRLNIVQSEAVFAMLAYAPSQGHFVGRTDGRMIEPPSRIIGTGDYGPPLLYTLISLRESLQWSLAIRWPVQSENAEPHAILGVGR